MLVLVLLLAVPVVATLRVSAGAPPPRRPRPHRRAPPRAPMPGWGTIAALAGGTSCSRSRCCADLKAALLDKPPPFTAIDWDQGNLVTWFWLDQRGAFPMRDFWYPYGGQWTFAVYPLGPVWDWFYEVVVLGLFAWALYRLNGGRTVRTILCVAAFVVVSVWDPSIWRYGPALAPALCLAASARSPHPASPGVMPSSAWLAWPPPFWAPTSSASRRWRDRPRGRRRVAAGGAALEAVGARASDRRDPVRRHRRAVVIYWLVTHSFDGNIRLWLGLDKVSAGYAIDQVHLGPLTGVTVAPTIAAIAHRADLPGPQRRPGADGLEPRTGLPAPPRSCSPAGGVAFATLLKSWSVRRL